MGYILRHDSLLKLIIEGIWMVNLCNIFMFTILKFFFYDLICIKILSHQCKCLHILLFFFKSLKKFQNITS